MGEEGVAVKMSLNFTVHSLQAAPCFVKNAMQVSRAVFDAVSPFSPPSVEQEQTSENATEGRWRIQFLRPSKTPATTTVPSAAVVKKYASSCHCLPPATEDETS